MLRARAPRPRAPARPRSVPELPDADNTQRARRGGPRERGAGALGAGARRRRGLSPVHPGRARSRGARRAGGGHPRGVLRGRGRAAPGPGAAGHQDGPARWRGGAGGDPQALEPPVRGGGDGVPVARQHAADVQAGRVRLSGQAVLPPGAASGDRAGGGGVQSRPEAGGPPAGGAGPTGAAGADGAGLDPARPVGSLGSEREPAELDRARGAPAQPGIAPGGRTGPGAVAVRVAAGSGVLRASIGRWFDSAAPARLSWAVPEASSQSEPVILFTAFEPSGDEHAAPVIAELKRRRPGLRVAAWGGAKMERAGAEIVERTGDDAVIGMPGLKKIREHGRINERVQAWLVANRPAVHVPVDSPAANFPICEMAKATGARVVHLVAPQIWAWGRWRIHKLRRLTDMVLCLLPFEEGFFQKRHVKAKFIGHPLFDDIPEGAGLDAGAAKYPAGHPRLALMPGSRPAELRNSFPLLFDAFRRLRAVYPGAVGVVAATKPAVADQL